MPALTEQLALELAVEPTKLYKPDQLRVPGRFALCSKLRNGRIEQELYDVSQLDSVMRQVAAMPERDQTHFWISQSTLKPYAKDRRISSVMLLNAVWVDIDLAHPPRGFPASELPDWHYDREAGMLAQALVMQIEDAAGITVSQVVATGGGLLVRIDFSEAIPAVARPRWSSLQKRFCQIVADLRPAAGWPDTHQWRWPVDSSACDPSRVLRLVGTVNPRWGNRCRVVFDSGKRYDFDMLADQLLPYTREQVNEFRIRMAVGRGWTRNREKAAAAGIKTGKSLAWKQVTSATEDLIADEAARQLWAARFEFGRAVLSERGGAVEGHRNNFFWPLANALAWSCCGVEQLAQELAALHYQHFTYDGWTRGEAMQAAASVLKRMREGKDKLYRMRSKTFTELLDVTPDELRAFGHLLSSNGSTHNLRRSEWDLGVMGFEKMKGLSSSSFIAETRRRQSEAGRRSAEVRRTTHSAEIREKARELSAEGLAQAEIAQQLGVSQQSVSRWLRS